jgi:hypothetical protein
LLTLTPETFQESKPELIENAHSEGAISDEPKGRIPQTSFTPNKT